MVASYYNFLKHSCIESAVTEKLNFGILVSTGRLACLPFTGLNDSGNTSH
jgi:hypothetical protein